MRGVILAGGLLLILIGGCNIQRDARLSIWGEKAQAKVLSVHKVEGRASHTSVEYSFETNDRKKITATDRASTDWERPNDNTITVVYLANSPTVNKIVGSNHLVYWFLLAFGLLLTFGQYAQALYLHHLKKST